MKRRPGWRAWLPVIMLLAGVTGCQHRYANIIVFCAGDSLTAGGYPPFLERALRREGIKASILNYGRSGYTTAEYLRFLRAGSGEMKAERPDIVLLELGTNDVRVDSDHISREEFERNLREIIAIFQSFRSRRGDRPTIFLASIPPIPEAASYPFSSESVRRVASEINPSILAICKKENLPFVDNYALFQESPGLLPGVHPSPEGYKAMAANWLRGMKSAMKIR